MNKNRFFYILAWQNIVVVFMAVIVLFSASCNPARHIPENKYLLNKTKIKADDKNINTSELEPYLKQKPNRKMLMFFRFHLAMYNLSKRGKERKWKKWIRKTIGEEPVIWDRHLTKQSKQQLKLYLKNKGYYYAEVSDSIVFPEKQRVNVIYEIEANKPYTIREIKYEVDDNEIDSLIQANRAESQLKKGIRFDVNILQNERARIARMLKKNGYYNFTREYIFYKADTALENYQVDVFVGIKPPVKRHWVENGNEKPRHLKYKINEVQVYADYDPKKALQLENSYFRHFDTTRFSDEPLRNILFFHEDEFVVKPITIAQGIYVYKDSLYNLTNVEETYRHLSSLGVFRLVNITFTEIKNTGGGNGLLNCRIQLTPATQQSYSAELEGTNSSANIGLAGNLVYRHKNLFRGAEMFDLKARTALESQRDASEDGKTFNTVEYGIESRIMLPKMLLPFFDRYNFIKRNDPKTIITLAYNYQRRPDYTRTIANTAIGYYWQSSRFVSHIIKPIDFNIVKLPAIDSAFIHSIKNYNIRYSYEDHLIFAANYSFIYNEQDIKKKRDFIYFRANLESAGNVLTLSNVLLKNPRQEPQDTTDEGSYTLFNTRYAQYLKADFDFRYYQRIDQRNNLVYRFFTGVAYPYGNLKTLPFGRRYYSGGANSIRAWQVRTLGPGSFQQDTAMQFPNQTADIKLEANVEYRFKMFWVIEGAFFVDIGNIWAINQTDNREGALFEFNDFYKEVAIGTGLGLRLDFSFFVFRFDFGLKLREPSADLGKRWIPFERAYTNDDWTFNIGIGYPF